MVAEKYKSSHALCAHMFTQFYVYFCDTKTRSNEISLIKLNELKAMTHEWNIFYANFYVFVILFPPCKMKLIFHIVSTSIDRTLINRTFFCFFFYKLNSK